MKHLVILTALLLAGCSTNPSTPTTNADNGANTTQPTHSQQLHTVDDGDDSVYLAPHTDPDPHARNTAMAFAQAWVTTHPSNQWHTNIATHTTDEYAQLLATTDPANIPATRLTGNTEDGEARTNMMIFHIETDAGWLEITCTLHNHTWLVATADLHKKP